MVLCLNECFFFFFKQKTAYEMVRSDWSSDVCSSDLVSAAPVPERGGAPERATLEAATPAAPAFADGVDRAARAGRRAATLPHARERRVAARADGPRRDPRQLPVVRAGGGRASRARAPESDGAWLAGAGDGVRSPLAGARRRRGACGNKRGVAGDRG